MSDLRELYQEVILDHHKRPRNFRKLEGADRQADGFNPLCGDRIRLELKIEDGVVREVGFQGVGCAISTAAASMRSNFPSRSASHAPGASAAGHGPPTT